MGNYYFVVTYLFRIRKSWAYRLENALSAIFCLFEKTMNLFLLLSQRTLHIYLWLGEHQFTVKTLQVCIS